MRTGLAVGTSFAMINLLVILTVVLVDRTGGSLAGVVEIWVAIHRPITALLMPLLAPHIPSHGGGITALVAVTAYYAACVSYLFAAGFALGCILQWCTKVLTR